MVNIYLIGMMGSGKSTIGKIISKELNYLFIDGDDYIVENSEFDSIEQIFKDKGENYFRILENALFKELTLKNNCVIATGGGIVLNNKNILNMKKSGIIIYLKSSIDNLVNNLYNTEGRPLLNGIDLELKLNEIFKIRKNLYLNAADFIVDVSFKDKNEIKKLILNSIKEVTN